MLLSVPEATLRGIGSQRHTQGRSLAPRRTQWRRWPWSRACVAEEPASLSVYLGYRSKRITSIGTSVRSQRFPDGRRSPVRDPPGRSLDPEADLLCAWGTFGRTGPTHMRQVICDRPRRSTRARIRPVDLFDLSRPEHLDDSSWDAITLAQTRVRNAWTVGDLPEVVGKAKELVETVARVTIASSEGTIGDAADFNPLVNAAQKQLARAPGNDTSQDQNLRALANGARNLVTGIAPLRNAYGTGHGRARVPDVVEEMATVVLESAMLWSRWALRRLGHMLADYPNDLIAAVQTGTSRAALQERFTAAVLPQQSEEIQRSIGVAFGQQSAGGFGNATVVGVEPAINGGYDEFPIPYRLGLIEGMLFTPGGAIGMTEFYAPRFVDLLTSVPQREARPQLDELINTAGSATWVERWRSDTPVTPADVIAALREQSVRLPTQLQEPFEALCSALEPDQSDADDLVDDEEDS